MNEFNRTVALLSFLTANRGVRLRDAARATGMQPAELLRRLDSLSLCGVPPYTPSDYISYRVHGSGDDARLEMQFSKHFARPLNFTAQEALAMKYALENFARAADSNSHQQLAELQTLLTEALHGRAREVMSDPVRGFTVPQQTDRVRELLSTLAEAIDMRLVTRIEYYSSHRARLSERRVHPGQIVEIGTHLYLYAHCELARATRHFRLERIRTANLTEEHFTRRPPARRDAGRMKGMFDGRVRDHFKLRFSARVARDVIEDWSESPGATMRQLADGRVELTLPLFNQFWAVGFVTSFGDEVELLEPAWLRENLAQTLRTTLEAHRRPAAAP